MRFVIGVPGRTQAAWGKTIGLALCLALGACSDDETSKDGGSTADLASGPDRSLQDDGALVLDSSVPADGAAPADSGAPAWTCTLDPGGGPFSTVHSDGCKWNWTCPSDGNRQLYCETVSTASHTCTCKNTTTGATEKTFTSTDICTVAEAAIAARANAECGWNLP